MINFRPATLKKIETVLESISNGTTVLQACEAADIKRSQFYRWMHQDPVNELKYYGKLTERCQAVEDSLYKEAVKGNVVASFFWLKNRKPEFWKDKMEHYGSAELTVRTNQDIAKEVGHILGINIGNIN